MIKDYLKLAVNALVQRKLRSYLTMIGVFIGIAAVVSLIGLGEGLRNAIVGQFGSFGTDVLSVQAGGVQAGPPGSGVINPLTVDDVGELESLTGVRMVIPRLIRTSSVQYNNHQSIGYTGSMVDGDARKEIERILNLDLEEGRALTDGDRNKIVIGANFGDEDVWGKSLLVGDSVVIEEKSFEVVGIMKKQGSFIFDNIILMNEDVMRELYDDNTKVDVIAVLVDDQDVIGDVKLRVEKELRKIRKVKVGEEDFSVETPQNALATVNDTLFAVQLFVYIIAFISLIVGGIGLMNTMYTAVLERTKEIGIMKSIGARNRTIFILYFIESGLMGTLGGIIGIIIGVGLASGLSAIGAAALGSDLIRAHFSVELIFGALIFSFLLGCIAGITPALRAAKLHPVDALRFAK